MSFINIFVRDMILLGLRALLYAMISAALCTGMLAFSNYPIILPFVVLVSISLGLGYADAKESLHCARRALEMWRVRRQTLGLWPFNVIRHQEVPS